MLFYSRNSWQQNWTQFIMWLYVHWLKNHCKTQDTIPYFSYCSHSFKITTNITVLILFLLWVWHEINEVDISHSSKYYKKYEPVMRAIWNFMGLRQQYWPRWRSIKPILPNIIGQYLLIICQMFMVQTHWSMDIYNAIFSLIMYYHSSVLQPGEWCYYCDIILWR